MKRKISLIASILLIIICMAGCQSKSGTKKEDVTSTPEQTALSEENSSEESESTVEESEKENTNKKSSESANPEDVFNCDIIDDKEIVIDGYDARDQYEIVVIPPVIDGLPVVGIINAFSQEYTIKEVIIPDSVKTIGESSFSGCTSLQKVTIGKGVETIEKEAFFDCESLTEINFPEGLITIGETAFGLCKSLSSIEFPSSLTKIEPNSFLDGKTVITAPAGSAAEKYATENKIEFISK